jgi:hypothetical protein
MVVVTLLLLLYWVIAVDETFVVAIGYVPSGDRAVQARWETHKGVGSLLCGQNPRNREDKDS